MDYQTILCPINGTELAEMAIKQAVYLCKISGAKLILLTTVEKYYHAAPLITSSKEWDDIHKKWLSEAEDFLDVAATNAKEKGAADVETLLCEGDAAHEIVAAAVERRANLIVMATHRYSPIGKLFMGSVTDKVTKNAPCPVLWVFKERGAT